MGVHGSAIGYCSAKEKVSGSCPYPTELMGSHLRVVDFLSIRVIGA